MPPSTSFVSPLLYYFLLFELFGKKAVRALSRDLSDTSTPRTRPRSNPAPTMETDSGRHSALLTPTPARIQNQQPPSQRRRFPTVDLPFSRDGSPSLSPRLVSRSELVQCSAQAAFLQLMFIATSPTRPNPVFSSGSWSCSPSWPVWASGHEVLQQSPVLLSPPLQLRCRVQSWFSVLPKQRFYG